ncbi:uncharacterized protein M6B38_273980 [Iris pallida]|uniref:Uncharacterized protein n=1 Tax=Iris pallida TaxID=29817 RepID=A0AAX6I5V3_IRIPA|nr:uncharacterized protein M6B38_273980 [Iris pallida]
MEEEKAAVEDAVAGAAAADAGDDLGEGMQCSEHPYRTNPGGICAFCLQEKLGNLLSAAAPNSFFTTTTLANPSSSAAAGAATTVSAAASAAADVLLLKASNSVAPRPLGDVGAVADSPRKKKHFWSFLYHSSSSSSSTAIAKINQQQQESADAESSTGGSQASSSSFGRKVARSRSVGCGSRSFSGDFLERISTGFGDCTLRRVESQREARKRPDGKVATRSARESRMKERARCGGIFRGLGMSSAASYWLSSSAAAAAAEDESSRMPPSRTSHRNRNWGWAFASPMRAFKPVSAASKPHRPANSVAGINISTGSSSSSNISNGNPPSSLPAVGGGGL